MGGCLMKKHLKNEAGVMKKIVILAIGVCLTFSFTGCFLFPTEETFVEPKLIDAPKVEYQLVKVKKSDIENAITCIGYFKSVSQKDYSFVQRSGRLKSINVKVGDKVKKGTLLAELESGTLETQVSEQEIALNKSILSYELLKKNGPNDLELAKMQLDEYKEQLKNATDISGAFSNEDIENLKNQIKKQELTLENAQATYDTNISQAEQDIALAKLQLEDSKKELESSKLVSTIEGEIDYTLLSAKRGDTIDAFQTIVRVADPTDLQLEYSEDQVGKFELGNKVGVTINSKNYEGEVVMTPSNMPQDADAKTKNSIRIKINTLPKGVNIGDSAEIKLVLEKKENVIVISTSLIHSQGTRVFVRVLENNIREERNIELGIQKTTEVEVKNGLTEGEEIIK
jgi:membrane fusion protein, macrolide-specific efflux system